MKNQIRSFAVSMLVIVMLSVSHNRAFCQSLKKSSAYFGTKSKVCLIVNTTLEADLRNGRSGLGLMGALMIPGKRNSTKYDSALLAVQDETDPKAKLDKMFREIFTQKGKEVIPEAVETTDLVKFVKPTDTKKKYFATDLRFLKDKYGADEVLIVSARYGIHSITSLGAIEQNRSGFIYLSSEVVNLTDNSVVYTSWTYGRTMISGNWKTPPAYNNVQAAILSAVDKDLAKERKQYNSLK